MAPTPSRPIPRQRPLSTRQLGASRQSHNWVDLTPDGIAALPLHRVVNLLTESRHAARYRYVIYASLIDYSVND